MSEASKTISSFETLEQFVRDCIKRNSFGVFNLDHFCCRIDYVHNQKSLGVFHLVETNCSKFPIPNIEYFETKSSLGGDQPATEFYRTFKGIEHCLGGLGRYTRIVPYINQYIIPKIEREEKEVVFLTGLL